MGYSNSAVIVRLPNWVGDVIMALPTIHALQAQGIELYLLGKPWIKELLAGLNLPLFVLEKKFWANKKIISQIPANKMLLLTNSLSSALLARLAGKETIGYVGDHRRFILSHSLKPLTAIHEVNYFWNIAAFACEQWFTKTTWPAQMPDTIHLPLSDRALITVKTKLEEQGIQHPFWVLCPFAHGTGVNKQSKIWPFWPQLSQALQDKTLLVCPGPNEEAQCEQLVPHAKVLAGLNLAEYAALLSLAERVIANDSGPMHIAAALNPTTLGIFGVSDPQRTKPWGATYVGSLNEWPSLENVLTQLK